MAGKPSASADKAKRAAALPPAAIPDAKSGANPVDLAIICGYGQFPAEVAAHAAAAGHRPYLIGIEGEAGDEISAFAHERMAWGQLGRLFRRLDELGIRRVAFAGGVHRRPEFRDFKLDWGGVKALPRALAFMLGGDNTVLSGTIKLFETRGIEVVGAHQIAPGLLAPSGRIGALAPGTKDIAGIRQAFLACKALGAFDIGQAAVAEGGRVVAVEGLEGTDEMLLRIARLRAVGKLSRKGTNGVLVKAMKPGQDMRADLPAIGPKTVENVAAAGLAGVALEAGHTLILERQVTTAAANRLKVFLHGIRPQEFA